MDNVKRITVYPSLNEMRRLLVLLIEITSGQRGCGSCLNCIHYWKKCSLLSRSLIDLNAGDDDAAKIKSASNEELWMTEVRLCERKLL